MWYLIPNIIDIQSVAEQQTIIPRFFWIYGMGTGYIPGPVPIREYHWKLGYWIFFAEWAQNYSFWLVFFIFCLFIAIFNEKNTIFKGQSDIQRRPILVKIWQKSGFSELHRIFFPYFSRGFPNLMIRVQEIAGNLIKIVKDI